MIKLVVGIDSLETFRAWQAREYIQHNEQRVNLVRTRFKPKKAEEIIESGGSIYRVIGGFIRCHQRIIGFDEIETADKGKQCLILTDTEIIPTIPSPKRAFQGWRYLKAEDTPADIPKGAEETGDPILMAELKQAGIL